ncbi:hypothetical protein C1645_773626 [Glomus cerebriforme]|uniref:Uncharacterized protein n=1 Tax=Glomus cerebriforme TaxID=658196 RepID=A0A397T1N9_9GLOM|nr:hypothetical protein C1645_773626 [Glomus cerebriforme]
MNIQKARVHFGVHINVDIRKRHAYFHTGEETFEPSDLDEVTQKRISDDKCILIKGIKYFT